jgi:capsular exopolysaccharide synthesis family protein
MPQAASAAPPPALPQPVPQPVHLLDRLTTLLRHVRLIVAVFVAVFAIGVLQSFTTVPRYRARATILIQDERSTSMTNLSANESRYWEDPEPYFNTQFQILRGRALGKRVVERLDLVNRGIPAASRPDLLSALGALRTKASQTVRSWVRPAPPAEPPAAGEPDALSGTIAAFLGGVEVTPIKGTRLVEVSYDSTDPQFAANAINTLVDEYLAQNLDLRLRNLEDQLSFLTQELSKQQAKVEASERAMSDYKTDQNALSLDERRNIVDDQLRQTNDALTRARTDRLQKEALYNQIANLDGNSPGVDSFPAVAGNSMVQSLKRQLTDLEAERAKNAHRGPQHPEMVELNKRIEHAREQVQVEKTKVLEAIRNDYRAAVANERSLVSALEDQKTRAMDLDRKSGAYTVLQREAASEREVYQTLLQQEKELRVVRNSRANNVQLMDAAELPKIPYVPNRQRDLLLSFVLALALGVGLAFVVEYLDDTVKTPDEVTRRLNLPLLGIVPAVRGDRTPFLTDTVPHDFGEAFRSLRTSLVFTSTGQATRVVGVTSTQPLEGKTTTACNLAMVLAYGGARVLLIDADMRRPGLHRTMRMTNSIGLSHVLTGQARLREVVRPTGESNLLVITAGHPPPNPSELLGSERMRQLLAHLAHGPFDWVIIDTPPVLAVTDAVLIAPHTNGYVFVIGSEMTRAAHAERAIDLLQASQQPIVGAVLNRVDFDRNKYYYSRYYGYQYKSYYGQTAASA